MLDITGEDVTALYDELLRGAKTYTETGGLLYTAETDKFTGYRQYSAEQIPLAQNILLLRDLGFSIDKMIEVLLKMNDFVI